MKALRTPDSRFENLKDYPFDPNYFMNSDELRMHYVDEGDKGNPVVLLLHGEPTWSYLYRKMIPIFVAAGYRTLSPDLIGFGKSDKPLEQGDYSYDNHLQWLQEWLDELRLERIHLFCQDWGGLLGLRLLANQPEKFEKVVASNTFLPIGRGPVSQAFLKWQTFAAKTPNLDIGRIVQQGSATELSPETIAAYDAPFPDESYKAGAKVFPALVPIKETDPGALDNQKAWEILRTFEKPFLTLFGEFDMITKGGETYFQKMIPGAKGLDHDILKAGHFIQEDLGAELAKKVSMFFQKS